MIKLICDVYVRKIKRNAKQGVFKLIYNDIDLDTLISNAKGYNDIEQNRQNIEDYITQLDIELGSKYSISISDFLSDFCDKFYYDMFDIYYSNDKISKGIYESEISYGNAEKGQIGLSSDIDVKFKLEERKLFKLINHTYIKLKSKDLFQDDIFYISFEQLKTMFAVDANNKEMKDIIINACNRLNDKRIYWDLQNTKYKKKLSDNKLTVRKNEKLLDIIILYHPRHHKKGINGEVLTIKGIICKVTNLMRMRYTIKQISNKFPSRCLRTKYLEFMIAEILTYYLNLLDGGNSKRTKALTDGKLRSDTKKVIQKNIKNSYEKSIRDLIAGIHYYGKEEESTYYFRKICENSSKSKERIENVIGAIANVSYNLMFTSGLNYKIKIIANGKPVSLYDIDEKKIRSKEEIYKGILKIIDSSAVKGRVLQTFISGDIKLRIDI